jgi:SAM-dependent methyltransferase
VSLHPPENWSDVEGWNRYLREQVPDLPTKTVRVGALRFATFIVRAGARVWLPGCGVDLGPVLLAALGCDVTATDLSDFAIDWQRGLSTKSAATIVEDWHAFLEQNGLEARSGQYHAERQDFLETHPEGLFDVIVNQRAFSQLEPAAQNAAARNFERSLRPNGHLIVDTLNVQGDARNELESCLLQAGFFIPGHEAERWYRDRLDETRIVYAMVLGRPIIPQWGQYAPEEAEQRTQRDKAILASFRAEYEARAEAGGLEAQRRVVDGVTKIAHVVYSTG